MVSCADKAAIGIGGSGRFRIRIDQQLVDGNLGLPCEERAKRLHGVHRFRLCRHAS